ncbi:hypothetical protein F7725_005734 [Dissostichus mawsoni]|uniref:Uncharacterized protein n=1 Tax=Dissostichus mawsoni TaxID=36200 RepID=A0A7J5YUJ5_DISMA|nr:hypothetical protein F7725_005734 [Dissostichus mawsoni]
MAVRSSGKMDSVVLRTSMLSSLLARLAHTLPRLMPASTAARLEEESVIPTEVSVEEREPFPSTSMLSLLLTLPVISVATLGSGVIVLSSPASILMGISSTQEQNDSMLIGLDAALVPRHPLQLGLSALSLLLRSLLWPPKLKQEVGEREPPGQRLYGASRPQHTPTALCVSELLLHQRQEVGIAKLLERLQTASDLQEEEEEKEEEGEGEGPGSGGSNAVGSVRESAGSTNTLGCVKLEGYQLPLVGTNVRHAERTHHAPSLKVIQGHVVHIGKCIVRRIPKNHFGVLAEVEAGARGCRRGVARAGRLVVHRHDAHREVVQVEQSDDPGVVRYRQHRFGSNL